MSSAIRMWTFYDHPRDHPNWWVLRCSTVTADGPVPDRTGYLFGTREKAEAWLEQEHPGLAFIPRVGADEPPIVGVFL